ncbi:polyisoprenoid-binding protein [Marmoricola sp. Leaf446]|uniref:YceI family protein n=1 Tax=Marmoricola sp. Leaf446 TaxID=1736379 RepID=UPI0006F95D29|nr:YceI family protein [Marmoricola sp. Leaf446]KQT91549.1 polyisoprenoid-binding protein [Marmoricola sp. Leaf446]
MGLFNRSDKSADAGTTSTAVFDAPTAHLSDISGDYVIDASHTRIGFSARHAMVTTVRGSFGEFEGTAHVDTANPSASSAKLVIKTASIDTGSADRDGHLRSGDFFDADANPEITFTTTQVERVEDDVWRLTGDLAIKGVSKSVAIDFESTGSAIDPFGNTRIGFEGTTSINRKDWGLTWNAALETGGVLVSEKIKLEFDVSAIKSA